MRFMMMVRANKDSEAGVMPEEQLIAAMTKYNEELAKAGALLDLAGLQPSSKGVRVKFSAGTPTVVDGPFAETKELIAGYWLIQAKSKERPSNGLSAAPIRSARGARRDRAAPAVRTRGFQSQRSDRRCAQARERAHQKKVDDATGRSSTALDHPLSRGVNHAIKSLSFFQRAVRDGV
jgi:hypothetical protein